MTKMQVHGEEFGESFLWPVPISGHKVVGPNPVEGTRTWGSGYSSDPVWRAPDRSDSGKTEPDEQPPWLIVANPSEGYREYRPLTEEPTLYKDFAKLALDAKEILDFSNRYGMLLGGQLLLAGPTVRTDHILLGGESLWLWAEEIIAMREAVELVDAIRDAELNSDKDRLEQLIIWRKNQIAYNPGAGPWRETPKELQAMLLLVRQARRQQRAPSGPEDITIPLIYDPRFKDWARDRNLVDPAKEYLVMIINKRIRGNVSPQLRMVEGRSSEIHLRASQVPHNLLGAMWLQVFQDFAGMRRIRECPLCGKWFDAVNDPRQVYCRTRASGCRKKAARIRAEVKAGGLLHEVARKYKIPMKRLQDLLSRGRSNEGPVSL